MPSSAIRSFDYREARRELLITFTTGRRYLYLGAPPEVVSKFTAAESKGRFFNLEIRDHYPYRELAPEVT
jgi:hypothetical protein